MLQMLWRSDIVNRMGLRKYKPYEWTYKKNAKKEVQNATDLCVISDFRRRVYEKCALL
jgi:hypothetical protein